MASVLAGTGRISPKILIAVPDWSRLPGLRRRWQHRWPGSETPNMPGRPIKVLNVAEKNDAAKNIAGLLSGGHSNRREGLSKFNKIYQFKHMVRGQECDMVMTSVSGHLLELSYEEKYRKWYSCQPVQLFDLPLSKVCREDNMVKIKKTLEREVKGAAWLIIWTDCDREGENIGYEVISVCQAVKPSIKIFRAKFSEITRPSVEAALANLGQPDPRVSAAVDVRQELDLRIGAAFTRFQTLRLQKKFRSLSDQLVSYGSCQFPTMGFVVERYKAIENFIPEAFYKIRVTHVVGDQKVEFNWKRGRLFDRTATQCYHDICLERPTAKVEDIKSKPKSKWRPAPMDTVELEKLGSRKLRLSAKEVMRIAEKLYTSGFISYPRTETTIFPKEIDLTKMVRFHLNDNRWGGDEARVYELIVRHFLACVSKDAFGKETSIHIDINGEKFSASGLMVTARNYLDVYPYDKWSDKEIPNYEGVREFQPTTLDLAEGQTQPPQLLTEADLIALMDKHGIGTDATHAEHIETVKQRQYIGIQDRDKLVPGLLGMALCDGYDAMGIAMSKPNLRAELESDLKRICEGVKDPQVVLREQIIKYRQAFEVATSQVQKLESSCSQYLNEGPG